jgi:HemY protein
MNRTLLYLVLTILIAGWFGHLVAKDPGYVLLSYDGATLQTSLWFFCGIMVVAVGLMLMTVKLVRLLLATGGSLSSWRTQKKQSKTSFQTTRGFVNLLEGNWARARDLLHGNAQESATPLISYLAAAKAAHELGDNSESGRLLDLAGQQAKGAERAIAICQAEFAAGSQDWKKVVQLLTPFKANSKAASLLMQANRELEDWVACKELLPRFKKAGTADDYADMETKIWTELLNRTLLTEGQIDTLRKLWKQLPGALKTETQILNLYIRSLQRQGGNKEAEAVLRKAINADWKVDWVKLYSEIQTEDLRIQLKTATSWVDRYPDDAAAQYCLGSLLLRNGDDEKAAVHLEASRSIEDNKEVLRLLGDVKARNGDMQASNDLYRSALELANTTPG